MADDGEYPVGTLAYYTCNVGLIHSGARSAICLESGYWDFVGDSASCTEQHGKESTNYSNFFQ